MVQSTTAKKNILLMVPTISHAVEFNFCQGVRSELPESEFNILHMTVGWIEAEEAGLGYSTSIHRLVNEAEIDGVIVYGAGITNRSHPEAIYEITNCYPNIPLVNVGNIVDRHPSIVFDNRAPFREFVRHLHVNRDYQTIAFLNGPPGNYDAEERKAGFLEGLAEYGLALAPEHDWPGSFGTGSGSFAVAEYFKQGHTIPDAIVCANDLMAIGVENELISRGYRIPEDCAVVGFDDLEYSKDIPVPLSTGRYPIVEMGRLAASTLRQWIQGKTPETVLRADSSVIYRQSTGDDGDPKSQLAKLREDGPRYFARDSNSDRLLISRAFGSIPYTSELLKRGASLLYDVGGRIMHLFRLESNETLPHQVYRLKGSEFAETLTHESPFQANSLTDYFNQTQNESVNWLISPIRNADHFFGFILMATAPNESDLVEFLANEFLRKFEGDAVTSERALLRDQIQKTEQMATLGRMVAGLAHELNSPLGVALVAASNMAHEVKSIRQLESENGLTKTAFDNFLQVSDETQSILYHNLKRSADLVASFKTSLCRPTF
jgi:DNA-binding LacI/PurR family transcriptional regulator